MEWNEVSDRVLLTLSTVNSSFPPSVFQLSGLLVDLQTILDVYVYYLLPKS